MNGQATNRVSNDGGALRQLKHPPGLAYIVGNEAAERFSYYGMKSILVVFMTTALLSPQGKLDIMSEGEATFWYHIFTMGNYLFPLCGALIADILWGKYKTIIVLSLIYCLGHGALSINDTRIGLLIGLSLIAIGSGGIKPCVSAHLGDQYQTRNASGITEGFSFFYVAINSGAFLSTLAIPYLFETYGASIAFGVPGLGMAFATFTFWLGRKRYVTLPPTPWRTYLETLKHTSTRQQLQSLAGLFFFIAIFWSLFDQTGSSWVLQAEHLSRVVTLPLFGTVEILPAQIQALNPLLIIVITPLLAWGVYPVLSRHGLLSTRVKIIAGMLLACASFVVVATAQARLHAGISTSILWQVAAYSLITTAEVLISITTLEMAYTASPSASKSLAASFYLLSVALGNAITAVATRYLAGVIGEPTSVSYFVFFSALPLCLIAPIAWITSATRLEDTLNSSS